MDEPGRLEPRESPILVLGSCQRCGSTLIQRLLTSHPEIMIWGEHGGHLRDFLAVADVLERWDRDVAEAGRTAFAEGGSDSWMANVLPGRDAIRAAARDFLLTLFASPAENAGKRRWGFKEVRFGSGEAAAFRELFPALVVIHITRDPRDVLISLDAWEQEHGWWRREFTESAIRSWVEVTRSFLDHREPWILTRRYEDVVREPDRFITDLADLLGADANAFDSRVFERRIHDYGGQEDRTLRAWGELPRDLKKLLKTPGLPEVAAACGYD